MAKLVEDKLERLEREEEEQQARGENLMSKNLGRSRMIIFGRLKGYDRMLSVSRDKTDPKWKPIHVPACFKSRERRISKLLIKTNWL